MPTLTDPLTYNYSLTFDSSEMDSGDNPPINIQSMKYSTLFQISMSETIILKDFFYNKKLYNLKLWVTEMDRSLDFVSGTCTDFNFVIVCSLISFTLQT